MMLRILHEVPGRIRFSAGLNRLSDEEADRYELFLKKLPGVTWAKVYERSGNAAVCYEGEREALLSSIAGFSMEEARKLPAPYSSRALSNEYQEKLVLRFAGRGMFNLFTPVPVRIAVTLLRGVRYIAAGLSCLLRGKLEVPVLDAAAITASLLRRDFGTASSVMFLLGIGELMEEWTHKKSVADLAGSMSLNVDQVWLVAGGTEVLTPIGKIKTGDCISVKMGSMIPLDGVVSSGEAMVNQASLTGESQPVKKEQRDSVYAGTVVEEGELLIEVKQASGSTRYEKIIHMIEDSERMKSSMESNAEHLADRLVPVSLLGTALTYLITRNVQKAMSILMVDFSCALKLSMPVTVLSAMRECSDHLITVKGGRFLEAVAQADTIVLDKTGTLTKAEPVVREVVPFGSYTEEQVLRIAACLEEHFPHSIANAVVQKAAELGLKHKEMHAKVHYVIAHGIESTIEEEKVRIGSYHFVFEDGACRIPEDQQARYDALPEDCSHLYLDIGGELAGVICIEDPLRPEAASVVSALRRLGLTRIVMMTGDSERTARAIAKKVGVDQYFAEVLPEDKSRFVEEQKALGHHVIMTGDGVNDSPALSAADAGIAISEGAQLAREIADITVSADDLWELVWLRAISTGMVRRIHSNYRFVIGFNGGLLAAGLVGLIRPGTSAFLHNMSTLGIGMHSLTNVCSSSAVQKLAQI